MNCRRCGGLMVPDIDRESVTGRRCVNCGCDGIILERPEGTEDDPPLHGCTFYTQGHHSAARDYCGERRKPRSKYCSEHYELTRQRNSNRIDRRARAAGPAIPFIPMGIGRGRRG